MGECNLTWKKKICINFYNYTIKTFSIFYHSLWIFFCKSWKTRKLVNQDNHMRDNKSNINGYRYKFI